MAMRQRQVVNDAKGYIKYAAFSREGLPDQSVSTGFSYKEAKYDHQVLGEALLRRNSLMVQHPKRQNSAPVAHIHPAPAKSTSPSTS